MGACPYHALPATALWKKSVGQVNSEDLDPIVRAKFTIGKTEKIATAGSCFAQHVARFLRMYGLNYFVAENAPRFFDPSTARDFGYGVYSARFGNIYTTRQLVQLFDRAFGKFSPAEDCWTGRGGGAIDPFRPNIQPAPFVCEEEMRRDRDCHLHAVRTMFEQMDLFVFTLGLTEAWVHAGDGAAFPLCPGCGFGDFDPDRHVFMNFTVGEIEADLSRFVAQLKSVNATAKILLTVSPVPLTATMSPSHVLTATTYSKSVLRVAAETISRSYDHVAYFPSYEVIAGPASRGAYYGSDLRAIRESGVQHAMRLFLRHYIGLPERPELAAPKPLAKTLATDDSDIIDVVCDEALLARYH